MISTPVRPISSPVSGSVAHRKAAIDPLARVLALGDSAGKMIGVALVVALMGHAAVGARAALLSLELIHWNQAIARRVHDAVWDSYDIEPPPPEPPKEEPKEEPPPPDPVAPKEAPPPRADAPKESPPPEAAQAGKVLAANEDPNEPVDLTNSFVQGTGDTYTGGYSQEGATGKKPTYNPAAQAGGSPTGTGTAPAPPRPDRSRKAQLMGSRDWDCPFPSEADTEQIDRASVEVEVAIGVNGKASTVRVMTDPGHGFGREARLCALRKTWDPALDRDGNPIAATQQYRITFER